MSSKNKTYLLSLGAVIIIGLAIAAVYFMTPFSFKNIVGLPVNQAEYDNQQKSAIASDTFINKNGERWSLDANAEFTVASGKGALIKFWEGKITPLKVHPGEVQQMRIVVSGVNGISKVIAKIETDHGTTTVALKRTGTITMQDLNPRVASVTVNDRNELINLSDQDAKINRVQLIKDEASSSNSALAADGTGDKEVYEGSWTVKDTSVRDYITVFVATDSQGNKNQLILAWSDPICSDSNDNPWPLSGNTDISTACAIPPDTVYGVENGDITLAPTARITIGSGSHLVFSPGKAIKMLADSQNNTGAITFINSGGSFSKGYLWAVDKDHDNFSPNTTRLFTTSPTATPTPDYVRQFKLEHDDVIDCNDNNDPSRPASDAVLRAGTCDIESYARYLYPGLNDGCPTPRNLYCPGPNAGCIKEGYVCLCQGGIFKKLYLLGDRTWGINGDCSNNSGLKVLRTNINCSSEYSWKPCTAGTTENDPL